MKYTRPATVPAIGNGTRRMSYQWSSRWHLDRPFPKDQRIGGPARIGDVLPAVLRNLATNGRQPTPGGNR